MKGMKTYASGLVVECPDEMLVLVSNSTTILITASQCHFLPPSRGVSSFVVADSLRHNVFGLIHGFICGLSAIRRTLTFVLGILPRNYELLLGAVFRGEFAVADVVLVPRVASSLTLGVLEDAARVQAGVVPALNS